MKRFLTLLLVALLAIGTSATWAMADDSPSKTPTPAAVVSLAGYDAFMGDIHYMAKLANNPELGVGLEGFLKLVTKNQGLVGLDKSRPWGAVMNVENDQLTGYAFLPVTDLAQLADAMEGLIGKVEDLGDGMHKIKGKNHNPPLFVKEGKSWIFLADKPEKLTNLPDDPSALLGGLEKQYQIAVRLNAGDLPEALRQKIIAGMESDAARHSEKGWNESEEDHALRLKMTNEVITYLKEVINQLQAVTLGWNLDTKADKCYLDANIVAKPGTDLAKATGSLNNLHSRFAGFNLSDAAIVGNITAPLPAMKIDLLKDIFAAVQKKALEEIEKKSDPSKPEQKQIVDKLFPLLQDTVASGQVDKGVSVVLKPDALTVVAGGNVVNDGRLEDIAKLIVEAVKKDHPAKAAEIDNWVKLGVDKYAGVVLHTVSIPIPADAKDRDKLVSLIGETLEVVIGTSNDSAYIAAGRNPMDALKKAIEQSAAAVSKSVPPLEISVSLAKVADFVAVVGKPHERPQAKKFADALKQSPSQDHAILRAQPIENGIQYRLEIEPGVLKAIGLMRK